MNENWLDDCCAYYQEPEIREPDIQEPDWLAELEEEYNQSAYREDDRWLYL